MIFLKTACLVLMVTLLTFTNTCLAANPDMPSDNKAISSQEKSSASVSTDKNDWLANKYLKQLDLTAEQQKQIENAQTVFRKIHSDEINEMREKYQILHKIAKNPDTLAERKTKKAELHKLGSLLEKQKNDEINKILTEEQKEKLQTLKSIEE